MREGLSPIAFLQYCEAEGYEEEIRDAPYPHPYLLLWLECVKQTNSMTGAVPYPDPSRGWSDQDADLTLACEVCEQWRQEQREGEEQREAYREEIADRLSLLNR